MYSIMNASTQECLTLRAQPDMIIGVSNNSNLKIRISCCFQALYLTYSDAIDVQAFGHVCSRKTIPHSLIEITKLQHPNLVYKRAAPQSHRHKRTLFVYQAFSCPHFTHCSF